MVQDLMEPPQQGATGRTRGLRLRTRFLLSFTAIIVAIMVVVVLLVEQGFQRTLQVMQRERGLAIARNLAVVCQGALASHDSRALAQFAERARSQEGGIAEVIVLDKEGRLAARSGGEPREDTAAPHGAVADSEIIRDTKIRVGNSVEPGLDIRVPVGVENEKWGTVRIVVSTEVMYREIRSIRLVLLALGIVAVGIGALGSFVMARRITSPLQDLVAGTIRAAQGDLDARFEIRTGDEIEELAGNLNNMVRQIRGTQQDVFELNRDLEAKVKERTEELLRANGALKTAYAELQQTEAQLVHSEKMASLGQFVAGIAHEINTPSSAISAAVFNMGSDLEALSQELPELQRKALPPEQERRFYAIIARALSSGGSRHRATTADIRKRTRELERMLEKEGIPAPRDLSVAFSRLGLHEEVAELLQQTGSRASVDLLATLGSIAVAMTDVRLSIDTIARMVRALRNYSHPDPADMREADIHEGLETTLTILRSQTKYGIVVERRFSKLPAVRCNTNELNQVWTNIIHNAVQAMKGMGTLTIETYRKDAYVAVRITDTGPGIPEAIQGRIFDPFFTTKAQGEGSGLGLGISHQIIERHHGRIHVDSEPGKTSFEVLLPLEPEQAAAS